MLHKFGLFIRDNLNSILLDSFFEILLCCYISTVHFVYLLLQIYNTQKHPSSPHLYWEAI